MSKDEKALRYNKGKPQWSLVDFNSIEPLVRVLEAGAHKYNKDNWKKGFPIDQLLDSLMRHVVALMSGEDFDKDTSVHHTGAIMFNAMAIFYQSGHYPHSLGSNENWASFLESLANRYKVPEVTENSSYDISTTL